MNSLDLGDEGRIFKNMSYSPSLPVSGSLSLSPSLPLSVARSLSLSPTHTISIRHSRSHSRHCVSFLLLRLCVTILQTQTKPYAAVPHIPCKNNKQFDLISDGSAQYDQCQDMVRIQRATRPWQKYAPLCVIIIWGCRKPDLSGLGRLRTGNDQAEHHINTLLRHP